MSEAKKVDLSREAGERILALCRHLGTEDDLRISYFIRALLDAKEAAERQTAEAYRLLGNADKRQHQTDLQLTEARASAAVAWEAGRDAARECGGHYMSEDQDELLFKMWDEDIAALTNPDPSATEALRRDRSRVWAEGYKRGLMNFGPAGTNPYAAKEAAHD